MPTLANGAWLVILHGTEGVGMGFGRGKSVSSYYSSMATIPMKTIKGCLEEGQRWASTPPLFKNGLRDYQCIEVK